MSFTLPEVAILLLWVFGIIVSCLLARHLPTSQAVATVVVAIFVPVLGSVLAVLMWLAQRKGATSPPC
jgi:hypothetical protein